MIAALYVDPDGPYPKMRRVMTWWGKEADALYYPGPGPIIVHPPCGPYGRMKGHCTKQDARLGTVAVAQVRAYGGALEHPADSSLWKLCGIPKPGELRDRWGGFTVALRQCDWGHCCAKPTWVYFVGVDPNDVDTKRPAIPPTHKVTNNDRPGMAHLKRASAKQARLTPPEFARWLVDIVARSAVRP